MENGQPGAIAGDLNRMQDQPTEPIARRKTRGVIFGLALLVALLAAFAYRGAITHDFTGGDTVALIEVSRIHSLEDLGTVLTQPMLPIITKFYRPTAALSYALDEAVWGFDAYGFHITDVAIHAAVCALIVLLVKRFSNSRSAAVFAGLAFALHPIVIESVPTSARRHDTLAALLILLTLYWLPRSENGKSRGLAWIPCLATGFLALGAKEGSMILPVLVFALELAPGASSIDARSRWIQALRRATPFLALAAVFFGWRAWILKGAGGNEYSWKWTLASIPALGENACDFFADLVYPLRVLWHPYVTVSDRAISLCLALGFLCLIPAMLRAWNSVGPAPSPARPPRAILYLTLIVSSAILLVPAVSPWFRGAVESAYRNEGWSALARMMDTPRKQAMEFYVWKAFDLGLRATIVSLLFCAALLALASIRARSKARSREPRSRLFTFACVWIALQLALFLAVQRYNAWYGYLPAIPFCILLGLGFAEGLRGRRVLALAFGGFVFWLAAWSPLVRGLDRWADNGKFNSMLMAEVARVASQAPNGSSLEFYDVPNLNFSWHESGPEPTSVYTFNPASMIEWIHAQAPDKSLRVDVRTVKPTHWPIAGIQMDSELLEGGRVAVHARVLPVEGRLESR